MREGRKEIKEREKKKKEVEENAGKIPYKHIPTHAAVDALSGAPSTWKVDDRMKIKEHHKRRSQLVISRTGSSLSQSQWASGPSSQAPPMPRNSSYSTYNGSNSAAWFDRGEQVFYSSEAPAQKRYKMARGQSTGSMAGSINGHQYHDSGIGPSPLASNAQSEEVSPVVSSGNSTTSNSSDPLEISTKSNRMSYKPQPNVYAEKDIFQRLHTSTTRKVGEAPLYDSPPVMAKSPVAPAVTELKQKNKKSRWSLMGKKNAAAIAA